MDRIFFNKSSIVFCNKTNILTSVSNTFDCLNQSIFRSDLLGLLFLQVYCLTIFRLLEVFWVLNGGGRSKVLIGCILRVLDLSWSLNVLDGIILLFTFHGLMQRRLPNGLVVVCRLKPNGNSQLVVLSGVVSGAVTGSRGWATCSSSSSPVPGT